MNGLLPLCVFSPYQEPCATQGPHFEAARVATGKPLHHSEENDTNYQSGPFDSLIPFFSGSSSKSFSWFELGPIGFPFRQAIFYVWRVSTGFAFIPTMWSLFGWCLFKVNSIELNIRRHLFSLAFISVPMWALNDYSIEFY